MDRPVPGSAAHTAPNAEVRTPDPDACGGSVSRARSFPFPSRRAFFGVRGPSDSAPDPVWAPGSSFRATLRCIAAGSPFAPRHDFFSFWHVRQADVRLPPAKTHCAPRRAQFSQGVLGGSLVNSEVRTPADLLGSDVLGLRPLTLALRRLLRGGHARSVFLGLLFDEDK